MRTNNTLRRISKDQKLAGACQAAMQKYLDAGHVEELCKEAAEKSEGPVNYIPIFPVVQPKKNKVRLVFDGSASYFGNSLNNSLLRGPDVANRLVGVLLRFRENKVSSPRILSACSTASTWLHATGTRSGFIGGQETTPLAQSPHSVPSSISLEIEVARR